MRADRPAGGDHPPEAGGEVLKEGGRAAQIKIGFAGYAQLFEDCGGQPSGSIEVNARLPVHGSVGWTGAGTTGTTAVTTLPDTPNGADFDDILYHVPEVQSNAIGFRVAADQESGPAGQ